MNLYQKLNEIKKKVSYIKKDKEVSGQGYKAVTHDAVAAETRQWFTEFGVLVTIDETESRMIEARQNSKGNPIYRFEAKYQIAFINCDDPKEQLTVMLTAHADDQGDKAPGKAASYATKYAILKVLQLETGENDEARQTQNLAPGEELTEEEMQKFLSDIDGAKSQEELLKVYAPAIARASKDRDAKAKLVQAKDARKLVLSAQKGGAK